VNNKQTWPSPEDSAFGVNAKWGWDWDGKKLLSPPPTSLSTVLGAPHSICHLTLITSFYFPLYDELISHKKVDNYQLANDLNFDF